MIATFGLGLLALSHTAQGITLDTSASTGTGVLQSFTVVPDTKAINRSTQPLSTLPVDHKIVYRHGIEEAIR